MHFYVLKIEAYANLRENDRLPVSMLSNPFAAS